MLSCTYSLEWGGFFEKSKVFRRCSGEWLPELLIGAILTCTAPCVNVPERKLHSATLMALFR